MLHHLLTGGRMLAFSQPLEFGGSYHPFKSHLGGEPACPFALHGALLRVIVLLRVGELFFMI